MGLDMYAFTAKADAIANPVEIDLDQLPEVTQIYAWRKHPNLHGWMAGRYYEKGGSDDDFSITQINTPVLEPSRHAPWLLAIDACWGDSFFPGDSDQPAHVVG